MTDLNINAQFFFTSSEMKNFRKMNEKIFRKISEISFQK